MQGEEHIFRRSNSKSKDRQYLRTKRGTRIMSTKKPFPRIGVKTFLMYLSNCKYIPKALFRKYLAGITFYCIEMTKPWCTASNTSQLLFTSHRNHWRFDGETKWALALSEKLKKSVLLPLLYRDSKSTSASAILSATSNSDLRWLRMYMGRTVHVLAVKQ